ncbi:MAG: hypothetical protein FWD13_03155 [Treponema sp.]|nr:hypothetical protein [Treponema sp.]
MFFFRSVLPVCLISLLAAAGLFFLGLTKLTEHEELTSGYAVLTTDASINDRYLRSLLETGGFSGDEIISESSQWVLLDEFDSLKKIPLDSYFSRIFPFDPRYDEYAEKLISLFIKDNRRYIYIPLNEGNINPINLDKQLSALLGDIPYTINYFGVKRSLSLFFIIYAAASFCMLIICLIKRKQYRGIAGVIAVIPVIGSLAFFGAAGIGCAALLFALFIFLKEPITELLNSKGNMLKKKTNRKKNIYKEIIFPYRFYLFFLPVFAAAFIVLIVFSQINVLFFLAVFAAASAVFFFSLVLLSLPGSAHRRFSPVLIMRRHIPEFVFPVYILPFTAGALLALFFTPVIPGSFDSNEKFDTIINEQDYYDHLTYQTFFSTRPLGMNADPNLSFFPGFYFDTDGLPAVKINNTSQRIDINDYPPFPLEDLMEFFIDVNDGNRTNTNVVSTGIADKLSLLVLLLFLFPGLIRKKKNDNSPKISGKRFYGNLRLIGINWNKKLLYNGKNQVRNRKDA